MNRRGFFARAAAGAIVGPKVAREVADQLTYGPHPTATAGYAGLGADAMRSVVARGQWADQSGSVFDLMSLAERATHAGLSAERDKRARALDAGVFQRSQMHSLSPAAQRAYHQRDIAAHQAASSALEAFLEPMWGRMAQASRTPR